MSTYAIRVRGLSKGYSVDAGEPKPDTFLGSVAACLASPWKRRRMISRLGRVVPLETTGTDRDGNASTDSPDVAWALRNVSFDVAKGEVIGIIGGNGAGKSTLLKILSRITEPTSGRAEVAGTVGSLLEVGTGFHPDLTGRENVYLNGTILGMRRRDIARKFDDIMTFAGVERFADVPVKRYSSGMRVRLAFAVAAHLDPEILIVDEVLAVGDLEFQHKCLGRMRHVASAGRTVLFVSHDMEAISTLCSRTILLDHGKLVYDGASAEGILRYQSRMAPRAANACSSVLFERERDPGDPSGILRIETVDFAGEGMPAVRTWDDLAMRVDYFMRDSLSSGSLVLDFFDQRGVRVAVLESGRRQGLRAGRNTMECRIGRLPLAAGEYFVGAGLADSRTEWLWRNERVCLFRVLGRDVFGLGRPPKTSRMLVALPHEWRWVGSDDAKGVRSVGEGEAGTMKT